MKYLSRKVSAREYMVHTIKKVNWC